MKKLFFVCKHPSIEIGGSEMQALKIAIGLKEKGYDVSFICPSKNIYSQTIDSNGINIIYYKTHIIWLYDFISCYNKLRKFKKDAYYIRSAPLIEGVVTFFSKNFNKKSVTIWHNSSGQDVMPLFQTKKLIKNKGFFSFSFIKNILRCLTRDVLRDYTLKNCNYVASQTQAHRLLYYSIYGRNSLVINQGLKIKKISLNKRQDILNIIFLRNIKERSGLELYIKVASLVRKANFSDRIKFYCIGRNLLKHGNLYEKLMKDEDIIYLGQLDNDNVQKHLKEMHVLVDCLQESSQFTTFSNAHIEAWFNGVVVLSYSSNPDGVLEKNQIGYSFNSAEECKERIINLCNNRERLIHMSNNAIKYAKNNHNIKETVAKVERLVNTEY